MHIPRYVRNIGGITSHEQSILFTKTVLLVGLGGLGGYCFEHLLRLGIGTIVACDPDSFEPSNLNRQLLATEQTMKQTKADAAKERARCVNSLVHTRIYTSEFEPSLLEGVDVAIDALGGAKDRRFLTTQCQEKGVPLVSAGVAAWTVFVATTLPTQQQNLGSLMGKNNAPSDEEIQGTIPMAVSYAACLQVAEVLALLTKGTSSLAGKILYGNLATMQQKIYTLEPIRP